MDVNIRPVWAEVNLDNIRNNINEIKKNINSEECNEILKKIKLLQEDMKNFSMIHRLNKFMVNQCGII